MQDFSVNSTIAGSGFRMTAEPGRVYCRGEINVSSLPLTSAERVKQKGKRIAGEGKHWKARVDHGTICSHVPAAQYAVA